MDEQKEKRPASPAKKEPVPLHGARQSKVDPGLMTILQHEAHKLRIFKLTMGMAIVVVVIGVIVALISYFKDEKRDAEYIAKQVAKLDAIEKTFSTDKTYDSAVAAVRAMRLAEHLIDFGAKRKNDDIQTQMAERVEKYRKVILETYPIEKENFVTATSMLDMVSIPAGQFFMGASDKEPYKMSANARPQNRIRISKPFWMARREVDVWQARKLLPGFKIPEWNGIKLDELRNPAGRLTWDQAMFFCVKLTAEEKKLGRVPDGYEYRLPTEAEWEYACRAGTDTVFYWGDRFGTEGVPFANSLDRKAGDRFGWKTRGEWELAPADPFAAAAPCGSLKPNAWGLFDMSGNVSEWCYDYFSPTFYKTLSSVAPARIDPRNDVAIPVPYTQFRPFDAGTITREIPCKVIRGGNWGNTPDMLRSSARDFMPQNESNNGVGFRPVLAPVIRNKIRNDAAK